MSLTGNLLPFALPDLDDAEVNAVREVIESGWITTGPKVQQFQQQFAYFVGARHAVAVNSCTAAMHVALEAIGVSAGDFVVTTPYTFAATAEVIRYFNATPVFVDVEPDTLNIAPQGLAETLEDLERSRRGGRPSSVAVRRALGDRRTKRRGGSASGRVRALIPVHIAGHPCAMDELTEIAACHALPIVEDCAHACPASFRGRWVGSALGTGVSSAACFSFYATKTLATGEGGMITTDSDEWADRYRVMSLHGISKDAWKRYTAEGTWRYEIVAPGFKYNMADIMAALGLAQLRKVDRMRARREEIARRYTDAFAGEPALEPPTVRPGVLHAWHLYMLRLDQGAFHIGRDDFIVELKKRGIGTSVHFIPLHVHPYYRSTYGYKPGDFPVAYREFSREVSLPIYSKMSDDDVQRVIDAVLDVVARLSGRTAYAAAGC